MILAKFAGYKGWEDYLQQLGENSDTESKFFDGATIDASKLSAGDIVEIAWSPNRHCVFKHLGNSKFEVISTENSELRTGDTLEAHYFIEGEPLYINNLRRGENPPTGYLCGNKNGLSMVKLSIG